MKFNETVELLKKTKNEYVILEDALKDTLKDSAKRSKILVVPSLQGRVLTSTVDGDNGTGLGWVNKSFIEKPVSAPFKNYGGEERFWLGPEGGQYALYFSPGKKFNMDNWFVPSALNDSVFDVRHQSINSIKMYCEMKLKNYLNTEFHLGVERNIFLLDKPEYIKGIKGKIGFVGYRSENIITNLSKNKIMKDKGLISIWILGQFVSGDKNYVIIPYKNGNIKTQIVNDNYFGKVPEDRLTIKKGYLIFKADGKYRSKIGLSHSRTKNVFGSIDFNSNHLTIIEFDRKDCPDYVNSMWGIQEKPYEGDIINSYNDGPAKPGEKSLGGFYELENSSPVYELDSKSQLKHNSRTYHFVAEIDILKKIAQVGLGIDMEESHA